MRFTQRTNGFVRAVAITLSLAIPLMLAISVADARPGGGGSRGARTFSAPPTTATAPKAAQPMQRSMTQPGTPAAGAAAAGAAAKKPGMGMLGGLAAGFLGAGLLGMLFGGGLFSGLGGIASIIGLIAQIALVVIVVRLAMMWWQRRNAPAAAAASASHYAAPPIPGQDPSQPQPSSIRTGGFGFGASAPAQAPLEIAPEDYEAFERLLGDVQTAWSNEDVEKLHTLATPEMVSYFTSDLKENADRGVVNKVSDVKLLQGDLSEAWREGETDYATVALRFGFVEKTTERAGGRVVDGSDTPTEATEIWTFVRRPGSSWELSAIQNT